MEFTIRKFLKTVVLLQLCILLIPTFGFADNHRKTLRQQIYFTRYYNLLEFSPRWILHNEADMRRWFTNHKIQQIVFRSHIHFIFKSGVDVGAGFGYFIQYPQDPESKSSLAIPELRPHQEITFKQNISKAKLSHIYRIEERFIHKSKGDNLEEGYNFNFRFRYRVQIDYPIKFKNDSLPKLFLKANSEIMLNAGKLIQKNTFDQVRFYFAANYQFCPSFSAELGYLKWFQQRPSGVDFFDRDILRLTLTHRIKTHKNSGK